MNDITLVYFEGCPEAKNVRAALLNAGVFDFKVVIQNQLPKADPLRKISSPSVLKGQELIYGIHTEGEIASCTFERITTVDELKLVERFRELKTQTKSLDFTLKTFVGPTLSALLVLKCPACIPGAVAFLSALGLGFVLTQTALKIILTLLLSLTLASLLFSYIKYHKNFYPLALGSIFSFSLYMSRFHSIEGFNQFLAYFAVAGLISTSIWDIMLKKKNQCPACL